MKTLYLECNMGIAGDMLMSALFELVDDKKSVSEAINNIGFPDTEIVFENKSTCSINGTYTRVICNGVEEGEGHHCFNRSLTNVIKIIDNLNINDTVRQNAINVYNIIADAESKVHNCTIQNIHFHEVGTLDAIADIVTCSYLIDLLSPDRIIFSPINTGSGTVSCAHGILPVPAPATVEILKGIPYYSNDIQAELCTPTGAALVRYYADEFLSFPLMLTEKIGYGIGKKNFDITNCVRAFLGNDDDSVIELACNIDDMTAEELSFACEVLIKNNALDVTQLPVAMKKSRLGTMLSVICKSSEREKFISLIFKHTTTIGIREYALNRYTLDRRIERISTPLGDIRKKCSDGYGIHKEKLEYEDLKSIAESNNLSIEDVRSLIK